MKALYDLRQVSRTWYGRINNYLQKQVGLKRNEVDQNTYFLEEEGTTLIFVLYVDDLLVIQNQMVDTTNNWNTLLKYQILENSSCI
jgi:hypothetical protein